jgi:hypothetical protein
MAQSSGDFHCPKTERGILVLVKEHSCEVERSKRPRELRVITGAAQYVGALCFKIIDIIFNIS